MCDKLAISAYILKIVEKGISTNKQYLKIKLIQNETNCWSIFW